MKLITLLTYSFDKNVGTIDRVVRIVLGSSMIALAWIMSMPPGIRYAVAILGAMIVMTGIVSRCGLYYLFGYGSCPLKKTTTLPHNTTN